MNKKEQLISDISEIKDGINSPTLEEKFKVGLREVLKKKESELASLKDEKPAEKKSAPAPAKKVSAPAKKEDAKKSPKSVLDNCREILKKHNKDKATANKRIEKRKKQGKPATLTPSESVSKTAKSVSTKVVQMDKGLPASEVTKLANGIVATIKSTLKGITSTTAKNEFLFNLMSEIRGLSGDVKTTKVAMDGGMFADGGEIDKNGLIYALQNDVSAGTIAGQTYANTYDEVAEVRHNALEILYRDGDKPYSLDNLIQLLKKAEKVDNRSFARVGRSQYEVGGALDGLMGDIDAPLQSVGGTLFSTADLTSHLDMNANPNFKNGGMMAKGGKLKVGDIVANKKHKTIGIVREVFDRGEIKTDADGMVDVDDLELINKEFYNGSSIYRRKYENYQIAPSTKKEISQISKGGLADYYEKKKYSYKEGGLTDENTEMLMSQIKEIKHHAEEIENLINNNTSVEAWVVAKAERSATDLSDITHYIDGKKETFEDGGTIKWQDVNIGDSANVKSENKTGVIVHTYGRKFNLKFVDGTEKTYDASELEFFKDDEEMFEDGGYVIRYTDSDGKEKIRTNQYGKPEIYKSEQLAKFKISHVKGLREGIYKNISIESYKSEFADGGIMKSTNIDAELKDFNLDDLDEFENMQFNQYYPSLGKVGALQVLINNVEGDYSQLSTELSELAEKQISNEEWDKESMRRYGYAHGGTLKGNQYKLDVNKNGHLDKEDFMMLRGEKMADGGRFNTGRAWTLDHYQHNNAESYEVPTKDRVYADGGMMAKGGETRPSLELYKKELQQLKMQRANAITDIDKFRIDKKIREVSNIIEHREMADGGMMAKGGLTEHGLQIGDKIIGKSRIENNIQVMNDGKYALVDLDEGSRIEGIFEDGGGIKGIYEGSVRRINEKDYLIDESVLNKNGDIVGWSAYEVVYDEKMGEKHINYERTKKQHHKYFKNNISLLGKNVGSQYYSHGGETDEKKKELKEIINEDYETFVKLLGENIKDDKFRHTLKELSKDNLIKYRVINVECKKMIPTQNEISLDKSLAFPLTSPSDAEKYLKADHPIKIKNNTILTCDNGKYIIDGHHRWSQVFVLNPNAIMSCTDFYQLKKPFSGLKATQLGISADLGYLPTSHVKDINLLTVSEKDLKKYVSDKITDEVKEVFKKYGINNPEEHIWKNVVLLKTHNKPVKNASKRDFMPQTDRAENFEKYTPNVSKLKKGGETTFAEKVKSIAEKHLKRKKVSPSVQKDYGKTYNKEEALDSAKRIVGAMRKKEMSKKKVKINTDGYQNLDTIDFDKDADMVVDNA